MDINKLIFTRTAPSKKVEIVKSLTIPELLSVTPDTIKRMVREVGSNYYRSRDKRLSLSSELRTGNNWNSDFEGVSLIKYSLYVDLYLQYSNTDTSTSDTFENFFAPGEYRGHIVRNDSYGNPRTYYFTYTPADKADCVKSLLFTYLYIKYKERLSEK